MDPKEPLVPSLGALAGSQKNELIIAAPDGNDTAHDRPGNGVLDCLTSAVTVHWRKTMPTQQKGKSSGAALAEAPPLFCPSFRETVRSQSSSARLLGSFGKRWALAFIYSRLLQRLSFDLKPHPSLFFQAAFSKNALASLSFLILPVKKQSAQQSFVPTSCLARLTCCLVIAPAAPLILAFFFCERLTTRPLALPFPPHLALPCHS